MKDLVTLLQNVPTIQVQFFGTKKEYRYKSNIPLEVGDFVIVQVNEEFKVVKVSSIDTHQVIETNCTYPLRWIVSKVDVSGYERLQAHDKTCSDAINVAESKRQRASMLAALKEDYSEEEFSALCAATDIKSLTKESL